MDCRFLSVNEVVALTSLSKSTIYRYAVAGKIPTLKLGRRRVFRSDLIERWIRNDGKMPVPADDEK